MLHKTCYTCELPLCPKESHSNIFPTSASTPTSLLNLLNNSGPEIGESTKQLSKINPKFEIVYKKMCNYLLKNSFLIDIFIDTEIRFFLIYVHNGNQEHKANNNLVNDWLRLILMKVWPEFDQKFLFFFFICSVKHTTVVWTHRKLTLLELIVSYNVIQERTNFP